MEVSGSVRITAHPDPGGLKLTNPDPDPEHCFLPDLLYIFTNKLSTFYSQFLCACYDIYVHGQMPTFEM
jgi:hypothetical protein